MKHQHQKGFTLKELIILIVIIIVLGAILVPYPYGGRRRDADRTKAVSHLAQVKIALTQFKDDHGIYPGQLAVDNALFPNVKAATANDCYRQLIQGVRHVRSEAIFFAPSRISRRPDNDIGDQFDHYSRACAKGEVGYLYVDSPSATDRAPIAAAPLYDTSGKFDYKAYNGKAVVLLRDGSLQIYKMDKRSEKIIADINEDGKAIDIFSPSNPAFSKPPVIKYPEPK